MTNKTLARFRASLLGLLGIAPRVLIRAHTCDSAYTAFLSRMPAGIPGDVNRAGAPVIIEPNMIDVDNPPLLYGVPLVLDGAEGVGPVGAATVAGDLYGLLVRPYPINQQTTSNFFGSSALGTPGVPPASGACDVLKSGYMTVKLQGAIPAVAGGKVYIRTQNPGVGDVVGGFEAAADGGNTIEAGAQNSTYFRGPADALGNTEIAWNV